MKNSGCIVVFCLAVSSVMALGQGAGGWGDPVEKPAPNGAKLSYPIVDTGQIRCYNNTVETVYPTSGKPFFGQDAQYTGNAPRYKDNGDGTVSDLVTGLMWQQDPGKKLTYAQAVAGAKKFKLAGHKDWRLPTIKELYSLIQFSGTDPHPRSTDPSKLTPFIDRKFFKFKYGDTKAGERIIDSQFATSSKYVSTTMGGNATMFGVNFADGRIKGYPISSKRRKTKTYHVLYVRENPKYGQNDFVDNKDGTITDRATGLTWMTIDSGSYKVGPKKDGKMNWQEALQWAEALDYAGKSDWRLPNAKELQSIVDYTRSPDTTKSAALDPLFRISSFKNPSNKKEYPTHWTSTTHANTQGGSTASYVVFGRGLGWMQGRGGGDYKLMDVHGAGSQRSDPKSGDPSKFPHGRGPQGDVIRIYNYARCVRGGSATARTEGPKVLKSTGGPDGEKPGGRFVSRLDKNGDGKISKDEFDGPKNHFSKWDKNGDGYISADEAPKGPPKGKSPGGRSGRK